MMFLLLDLLFTPKNKNIIVFFQYFKELVLCLQYPIALKLGIVKRGRTGKSRPHWVRLYSLNCPEVWANFAGLEAIVFQT